MKKFLDRDAASLDIIKNDTINGRNLLVKFSDFITGGNDEAKINEDIVSRKRNITQDSVDFVSKFDQDLSYYLAESGATQEQATNFFKDEKFLFRVRKILNDPKIVGKEGGASQKLKELYSKRFEEFKKQHQGSNDQKSLIAVA
jgi:hypothetical protein